MHYVCQIMMWGAVQEPLWVLCCVMEVFGDKLC
jgi:hypothetical protein